MRTALALALTATVLAGAPAQAAPRTYCNLVTDPSGDVTVKVPGYGPAPYPEPAVDIRSADVTSDAQGLGVTLRVGGLGGNDATHTGLGVLSVDYKVFLTIESVGRELGFHAYGLADNATGAAYSTTADWRFEVGRYLNDAQIPYSDEYFIQYGDALGTADTATGEIRMWVSWADLKKWGYSRARNDRAVRIRARAQDWWLASNYRDDVLDPGNLRYESAPRDDAATAGTYPLGARSCGRKP